MTWPDLEHDEGCSLQGDEYAVEPGNACERIDLPEDPNMICAGCGQPAGEHPAWSKP